MSLSQDDIRHLAELARLHLDEDGLGRVEKELDSILGYVERLKTVKTEGVEPFTMMPRAEGWRRDVAIECDPATRQGILNNFPARQQDALSVPAVFEKPKGS